MNRLFNNLLNSVLTVSCFVCVFFAHQLLLNDEASFIIAAFGASAVLVFSIESKQFTFIEMSLSAVSAAVIGVFFTQLELELVFKIALTITSCIFLMNLIGVSYPPAGAIAIIPLLPNAEIQALGYSYALYPTLTGLTIIYLFSKIRNNINKKYHGK